MAGGWWHRQQCTVAAAWRVTWRMCGTVWRVCVAACVAAAAAHVEWFVLVVDIIMLVVDIIMRAPSASGGQVTARATDEVYL